MIDLTYLIVIALAALHTCSYALYEKKQGNIEGAFGVMVIALASIVAFAYFLVKKWLR